MKDRVAMRYLSGLTLVLLSLLIWRCDVALGCEATGDLLKHLRNSDEIERLVASEKLVNSCDDFDNLRKAVKTMWSFLDKEKCETPGSNPCQIKLNLILALRHCSEKDEEIFPEMLRRLISQSDKKIEPSLRAAAVDILVESVEGKGLASDRRFAQLFRLVSKRRMAWSSVLPVLEQAFQELFRVDTVKLDTSSGGTATEFTDQQAGHVQEFLRHALDGGCNKTEKQRERASTNFTEMLCRMFGETLGTLLTGPSGQSIAKSMVATSGNTPTLTPLGKTIAAALDITPMLRELTSWLAQENVGGGVGRGAEVRATLLLVLTEKDDRSSDTGRSTSKPTAESSKSDEKRNTAKEGEISNSQRGWTLSSLLADCLLRSESDSADCLKQLKTQLQSKSGSSAEQVLAALEVLWARATDRSEISGLAQIERMLTVFKTSPTLIRDVRIAVWRVAESHLRTKGWDLAMAWIGKVGELQMEDMASRGDAEELAAFQGAMKGLVDVLQADWVNSPAAFHPEVTRSDLVRQIARNAKRRSEVWGQAKKRSLQIMAGLCGQFSKPLVEDKSGELCVEAFRRALEEVATDKELRSAGHLTDQDYKVFLPFSLRSEVGLSRREAWLMAGPLIHILREKETGRSAGQAATKQERNVLRKIFERLRSASEPTELKAASPLKEWEAWWSRTARRPPLSVPVGNN